jgi:hypothetical protein
VGFDPAFPARRDCTRDDEPHTAFGPPAQKCSFAVAPPIKVLQSGMQTAHDESVAQGLAADPKRLEQARIVWRRAVRLLCMWHCIILGKAPCLLNAHFRIAEIDK